MIADALRVAIEAYAASAENTNALLRCAARGRMTPAMLSSYLFNAQHFVAATPRLLALARDRARALGNEALAEHFAKKLGEEVGHDRWAEEDRRRVEGRFGVKAGAEVSPAIQAYLEYLEEIILRDPILYLAYLLFGEYHVVLMGPKWLALIEGRCNIPASMVSVIGKHAELDKDHTCEGFEAVDRLVPDPAMLRPMRAVIQRSIDLFERFCAEMTGAAPAPEAQWSTASSPS
jgi:pyrroloquinoline quinone (PQQ) biosynthesis protein C